MTRRVPSIRAAAGGGERQLTGRHVLIMLIAFFGVVTLVNVAMMGAAVSTFGGVDTPSSYAAGLQYKAEEARAAAQKARAWSVTARLSPGGDAQVLAVDVRDAAGSAVAGVSVTARLVHPVDQRRDVAIALAETSSGAFRGSAVVPAGQWRLDLVVVRHGEALFRSENRVTVR